MSQCMDTTHRRILPNFRKCFDFSEFDRTGSGYMWSSVDIP